MAYRIIPKFTAAIFLLLLLPLFMILIGALLLQQGRPVFFRQLRSGLALEPFMMVKFRTMRDDAGPDGEPLPDDMRMTNIGRFLRRTRLDELPELWNIMRGEMAFIGPRPLLVPTLLAYGEDGKIRGSILPGLTGWSQVNGNALLKKGQKLDMDIWYVRNHNIMIDLIIMVRTVRTVLFGEKISRGNLEKAIASRFSRSS